MRLKRLVLEGAYVEAYLYYDFLWLFTADGRVRAFDTERFIRDRANGDADALVRIFARNDGLATDRGPRNQSITYPDAIEKVLAGDNELVASESEVDDYSHHFTARLEYRSLMDVRFYYGRAYLATDAGIQQLRIRGRDDLFGAPLGKTIAAVRNLGRVWDAPCRQLRAKWGAVSGACGADGGVAATGTASEDDGWTASFAPFAERSYGTEFVARTLTNLETRRSLRLYSTDRSAERPVVSATDVESGDDRDRIASVGAPLEEASTRIDDIIGTFGETQWSPTLTRGAGVPQYKSERGIADGGPLGAPGTPTTHRPAAVSRVFLSTRNVFVVAGGRIQVVRLLDDWGEDIDPRPLTSFKAPEGRIVGTTFTAAGTVIESDDEVWLSGTEGWTKLFDFPVYAVRGYPASRWYRNVVTAVGDERTELVFVSR